MDWPLLAPLGEVERAAVLQATRSRSFAKGEVVFHEGDPADALHVIVSGRFTVVTSTPDGEKATLNVLGPGDHVGELSLVNADESTQRSATVVAVEKSETRMLAAAAFHDLCRKHPQVQGLLIELLADRVRQLSERLLESMYVPLDRRLARCLVDLADVYGADDPEPVIPFTQEQLADLVGGTRPSVNQVLQRLLARGIIDLGRGRVVIKDRPALEAEAPH